MATLAEIRAVKKKHSARLLKVPGICGVGVGRQKNKYFKTEEKCYYLDIRIRAGSGYKEYDKISKALDSIQCPVVMTTMGPVKARKKPKLINDHDLKKSMDFTSSVVPVHRTRSARTGEEAPASQLKTGGRRKPL